MSHAQAIWYLAAVVLLTLAALGVTAGRVSLPLLAAACFVAGFAWPGLVGLLA